MPNKLKYIRLNKSGKIVRVPNKSYRYPIQGIITECYNCKKPIYVSLCMLKRHKIHYCSKECIKTRVQIKCQYCSKIFERAPNQIKRGNAKFCSRDCARKQQTKNGIIETKCKICDKKFKIAKSVKKNGGGNCCCRDCYNISISGYRNVNWSGGYYQYYGYGFAKMVKDVRKRDKVCQKCGKTDESEIKDNGRKLSIHHIRPYDDFTGCIYGCKLRVHPEHDKYLYYNGINGDKNFNHPNKKENGILLCNKCHVHEHVLLRKQRIEDKKELEKIL